MLETTSSLNDCQSDHPIQTLKCPAILMNAPIGFFTSTPEGRFLSVNPAMARMLGYKGPEELMGSVSNIILQIYTDPTEREELQRLLEFKMEVNNYESRMLRRDGSMFWASCNARAVRYKKGNVAYYEGFIIDITQRKQAEKMLRESETKYRRITENIIDVVWIMDLNLKMLYLTPSIERLIGETVEQHKIKKLEEKLPPDSLEKVLQIFKEELEKEKDSNCDKNRVCYVEAEHYKGDGSTIWISMNASFIRDENGNPVAIQGVTRDISEQKKVEVSLRKSEARARRQREAIAGFVLDNLVFSGEMSEALSRITKTLAESMDVERASIWLFQNDYKELHCQSLYEASKGGNASRHVLKASDFPVYFAALRKENRIYAEDAQNDLRTKEFARDYLSPLGINSILDAGIVVEGTLAGIVCLEHVGSKRKWYSDEEVFASMAASMVAQIFITEKRRQAEEAQEKLQEQLNHARKMESVGQLAGGVAHDFNNMLNVIIGYSELALLNLEPAEPLHKKLREIHKAASRSADITRKLLTFARKQTIVPKVLDINQAVGKGLKILRRLIGEDVYLSWQPGAGMWPVMMDPSQIDQILTNLCVNARDAIAGAGRVIIQTRIVSFDNLYCNRHVNFLPGDYVMLMVSDDGCGMESDVLNKLFDPFFTTKEIGRGTGLGLATVYGIVKQNNGFVNVYSEPQMGSTFSVYIPRYVGDASSIENKVPDKPDTGGHETVLLVEDEPMNLDICQTMLENLGYRVLPAGTPDVAIELAEEYGGEIHLLLTDVVMPGMNGRELAEHIVGLYPGIKCLFMSGHTADMISRKGVLEESVILIQKPFTVPELAARVSEILADG